MRVERLLGEAAAFREANDIRTYVELVLVLCATSRKLIQFSTDVAKELAPTTPWYPMRRCRLFQRTYSCVPDDGLVSVPSAGAACQLHVSRSPGDLSGTSSQLV
jgi:hypothetical protein